MVTKEIIDSGEFSHDDVYELIDRIAELGRDKETLTQHHDMWKCQWHELHSILPIRDLEQQAKGLRDFSITYNEMATNPDSLVNLLNYCANVLLGKAKALKEGK